VPRFVPVVALACLLAGCGGEGSGGEGGGAATETVPDAITAPDSGTSYTLAVGDETSLRLSSEYVWSEPVVEGGGIEVDRVDYLQDPGFSEWLVRAVAPGSATISSLGDPACEGEHGCPDEAVRFQVTITVAE
jgi:predicted secreted protein